MQDMTLTKTSLVILLAVIFLMSFYIKRENHTANKKIQY